MGSDKLDVGLLHLGEAAAIILDEGSKQPAESSGSTSTRRKSTSPHKKIQTSKKQRAAEETFNAEYRAFLETIRGKRNTTAHAVRGEGFQKRKYEETEESIDNI